MWWGWTDKRELIYVGDFIYDRVDDLTTSGSDISSAQDQDLLPTTLLFLELISTKETHTQARTHY